MQGFGDSFGAMAEQPRHICRGLQMTFGVGLKPRAGGLQRHMFPDAGDNILQVALIGSVVKRVVDRNERYFCSVCGLFESLETTPIVTGIEHGGRQPGFITQCGKNCLELLQIGRRHDDQQ